MGARQSKEELLYEAVQQSNHQAVKTLRRDGAELEWLDKERRTPLVLACTRGDLYDMVITLLNEGANLNAYRPGPHGGYPLHHAAKRGLDKTVILLLSRGANPLALNDDKLTPLDMARSKNHVSVVRIIEDRICLFSGTVRELSGPGFLEAIVPQFVTKKIWVAVVPAETDPRKPARNELVIYQTSKVAIPRTVISLPKAEVEEPKFHHSDPPLIITLKSSNLKLKFLAEIPGDKVQLEKLYKACAFGIRQTESGHPPSTSPGAAHHVSPARNAIQGFQALMRPSTPQSAPNPQSNQQLSKPSPTTTSAPAAPSPAKSSPQQPQQQQQPTAADDDMNLAMAINASLITASEEGIPVSPHPPARQPSWESSPSARPSKFSTSPAEQPRAGDSGSGEFAGWADGSPGSYGGWGAAPPNSGAGPSRLGAGSAAGSPSTSFDSGRQPKQSPPPPTSGLDNTGAAQSVTLVSPSAPPLSPSAPPLPLDGPIHYPSIDTSPVQLHYGEDSTTAPTTSAPSAPSAAVEKTAAEEKEKSKGGGGGQCVVCWDASAEAVCIPCGHLAGCMDCISEIKSKSWGCPVCRANIDQVLKVYAV